MHQIQIPELNTYFILLETGLKFSFLVCLHLLFPLFCKFSPVFGSRKRESRCNMGKSLVGRWIAGWGSPCMFTLWMQVSKCRQDRRNFHVVEIPLYGRWSLQKLTCFIEIFQQYMKGLSFGEYINKFFFYYIVILSSISCHQIVISVKPCRLWLSRYHLWIAEEILCSIITYE